MLFGLIVKGGVFHNQFTSNSDLSVLFTVYSNFQGHVLEKESVTQLSFINYFGCLINLSKTIENCQKSLYNEGRIVNSMGKVDLR